jgi:hypothetical protein
MAVTMQRIFPVATDLPFPRVFPLFHHSLHHTGQVEPAAGTSFLKTIHAEQRMGVRKEVESPLHQDRSGSFVIIGQMEGDGRNSRKSFGSSVSSAS